MPAERFFIPGPLQAHQEVLLEGSEFHHLIHVMRLEAGERAEIVNGQGILAQGVLKRREKKQAVFLIESIAHEEKSPREIILAQALPRINRLDFIIEKGTELNATQFWLFPGQLSERRSLTEHQLERLQSLTVAAMKQCGRLFLPSILVKPTLDKWENLGLPSFFGDLRASAPAFLQVQDANASSLFFVGPESGFTDKEIERLDKLGATGVKLHSNILRTDTAALVALSIMSQ